MSFSIEKIKSMIFLIREQRVMLDSDLAKLYGVETKILNQAVKRNLDRFPLDFMFEPTSSELAGLRSQIVTLGSLTIDNHVFKYTPKLFTEHGVAMLSSVLKSKEAIQINIMIMRTFSKLKNFNSINDAIDNRMNDIENGTSKLFKVVFERLDTIEEQISPNLPDNRRRIGLKNCNKN
jgi:hypothetical protein